MKKKILLAGLLFGGLYAQAQCEAVAILQENFNEFTTGMGTFPQECWTASAGTPMMYIDGNEEETENYAVYYNMNLAEAPGYLVTPALSTLNGTYKLTFATWKPASPSGTVPADEMTVQVGTLTAADDFENFVAFGEPIQVTAETATHEFELPGSDAASFIAFKIIGMGEHNAVAIDDVSWLPLCEAVEVIDEDFETYADLAESCWSALAAGPMAGLGENDEATNQFLSFYSFMSANVPAYFVSPELTTIGTGYTLSFDAGIQEGSNPGNVTVQVGTLTDPADAETFTAVGDAVTLNTETTAYSDITIPSGQGNYIAFKVVADGEHVAALIDNVKYHATAGVIDNKIAAFGMYPNPAVNKSVTIALDAAIENGAVSIYTIAGAKVYEGAVAPGVQTLNLNGLSAGIYIVKLDAGNATAAKKLVIQ